MKLIRMELKNFCGVTKANLFLNGHDAVVYGQNGTGKTTLCDAYMWLFSNKDSELSADFDIKRVSMDGTEAHNMDHEVSGEFEIHDKRFKLRKIYKEIWTKKRGDTDHKMTGHTTDYEFDGVPVTKKEYDEKLAAIFGEVGNFLMLVNPLYFSGVMAWEKRREILIDIAGDIEDDDIFNAYPDIAELKTAMDGKTFEEYKKIIKAGQKKINKKLKEIPVRISEQKRNLIDVSGIDQDAEKKSIEDIEKLMSENEAKKQRIENGDEIQAQNVEIKVIQSKMLDVKNADFSEHQKKVQKQAKVVDAAKSEMDESSAILKKAKKETAEINAEISSLSAEVDLGRKNWIVVSEKEFKVSEPPEICETCGKPYTEVERLTIKKEALSEFNLEKSKKLEEIAEAGKVISEKLEKIRENFKSKVGNVEQFEKGFEANKETWQNELKELQALNQYEYEPDENYLDLTQKISEIEKTIESLKKDIEPEIQKIDIDQVELKTKKRACESEIKKFTDNDAAEKRITELTIELKEASKQFEQYEKELFMIDKFTQAKVEMSNSVVADHFQIARFKMFDVQVNGGLKDTCQTTMNGLQFKSCSGGEKIILGLDIIRTLQKHFCLSPPIFIDEAGEITRPIDVDCQTVRMIASVPDDQLRIVVSD